MLIAKQHQFNNIKGKLLLNCNVTSKCTCLGPCPGIVSNDATNLALLADFWGLG